MCSINQKGGRHSQSPSHLSICKMKDQLFSDDDDETESETTPERESSLSHRYSSLSQPISLCHTPSSQFETDEEGATASDSSSKGRNKKLGKKSSSFAYRIREHVSLGHKLSETVKGKLSLGAKIIQQGGRANIFKHIFGVNVNQGEKLLKASQCYLSTTAGPIPGLLFISTHKLAFCSETSITLLPASTPSHPQHAHHLTTPYKLQIPIRKIKRAHQSENINKPQQKYIEIVTEDDFDFWFMGFLRYEKAFTNLQKAISMTTAATNSTNQNQKN